MTRSGINARTIALSVAVGIMVVLLSALLDAIVDHYHPHGFWLFLLDDVVMGLTCAVIVLLYEQRRRRELAAKLSVIAEMNHRVRNQLEVIQYSAYAANGKENVAMIGESVSKIEAALSEILEGGKKMPPRARSAGADQ